MNPIDLIPSWHGRVAAYQKQNAGLVEALERIAKANTCPEHLRVVARAALAKVGVP